MLGQHGRLGIPRIGRISRLLSFALMANWLGQLLRLAGSLKKREMTADKLLCATIVIALSCFTFFLGSYIEQRSFEPKVVTEVWYVERPVKVYEVVEGVVEKEVEVEIVKEIPMEVREFESLEELTQFLEIDDTDSQIILYPIRGSGGGISSKGICDYYALQLQGRALEAGYLMSTEIIRKHDEPHMINSAVIGNEVYFIEPQTDEAWLWGCREDR